MTLWIDAQLSPAIAHWIKDNIGVNAVPLRDLGLRDSEDKEIFSSAREANAIVLTKDADFLLLLERHGSPPKVILLTCGNTSNASLRNILSSTLSNALQILREGEELVEIG